jgi:hypothetical protein
LQAEKTTCPVPMMKSNRVMKLKRRHVMHVGRTYQLIMLTIMEYANVSIATHFIMYGKGGKYMMKRKILGVSSLAWIITIAIVLLFVLMFMFDIVLYIVMGAIGISLALLVIYFIALGVDCMIN